MAASDRAQQQPPVTPRLLQYLAVPTDDGGLADAARCCEGNLRWAPQERDRATQKDWQAYQNLLQLTGILSTAGVTNARQVWKHVVDFVEMNEMAECEPPPAKAPKTSFKTAQDVMRQSQGPQQSPSPATAAHAEPFAGLSPKEGSQKSALSPAQIDRIKENRNQALARQELKRRQEGDAAPAAPMAPAPLQVPHGGESARSHG